MNTAAGAAANATPFHVAVARYTGLCVTWTDNAASDQLALGLTNNRRDSVSVTMPQIFHVHIGSNLPGARSSRLPFMWHKFNKVPYLAIL